MATPHIGATSYVYHAWGNLNQKLVTKCSAENLSVTVSANNQLQGGFVHDAAGNMTLDNNGTSYVYDSENRISSTAGFTYTYDADGNRVQKVSGSNGTLYWYMMPGIVGESDLFGNLQSEYIFFDGTRIARKDFFGNAISYYFSDQLKTASVIADAAGNIKSESDYYPWGGELQFANGDSNHYKFTGKERDAESGLDYFGARYYSNGLGRFITPDWASHATAVPYANFGNPQSLNLYTYSKNNPTTFGDPDGHCPECVVPIGLPPPCGLCYAIAKAFHEVRSNPRQAAADSGNALKAFAQNTINTVMPIGDNKPSPGVKVPAMVAPPKSAVGQLTYLGATAVTAAAPSAIVDMTAAINAPSVINLYRAVGSAEAESIEATGAFTNPFGTEVKYFSTTLEGAQSYAAQADAAFGDGPYSIFSTQIPAEAVTPEMQVIVDRGIPTVTVPTQELPKLAPPKPVPPE
ncbi:MAG TPA: RHS repeat-associated core domain-containing protein [Candidatus Angelobacter sp.]|nr:RHS repeat-associated core domain-containing protein [Candidatus Angelobacter sp.]